MIRMTRKKETTRKLNRQEVNETNWIENKPIMYKNSNSGLKFKSLYL